MGRHRLPEWPTEEPSAAIRTLAENPNRKWPPMFRVLVEGDRKVLRLFRDRAAVYVDFTEWRLGYKFSPAFHRVSLLPVVLRIQRHRRTPSPAKRTRPAEKVAA